jgi:tetratricopeptide (TPR) repeat protein
MADEPTRGRPVPRDSAGGGTGKRQDGSPREGQRDRSDRGTRSDRQRQSRRAQQPANRVADRRPERPRRADPDPPTDSDVTGRELDDDVRAELSTLSGGASGAVARHLVMAGRLLDDDPELAYQHALAARRRAARIGVVREAAGIAAYRAGRYTEALAELRAARRMSGSAEYLPMMADSERGLGRPQRALDLAADPVVAGLDPAGRAEMLIVAAGARRDLGQLESAAVTLQVPDLRSHSRQPWVARLRYAYADALAALGRHEEARQWFVRAAESDEEGETDAIERIDELDEQTGPADSQQASP